MLTHYAVVDLASASLYFATAVSMLKCMASCPRRSPNGERWTICNTAGFSPTIQRATPLALSLLCCGQHLERRVFEIGNPAEIERDYFWLCFFNQGSHLLCDVLGICEEEPAIQAQQ